MALRFFSYEDPKLFLFWRGPASFDVRGEHEADPVPAAGSCRPHLRVGKLSSARGLSEFACANAQRRARSSWPGLEWLERPWAACHCLHTLSREESDV